MTRRPALIALLAVGALLLSSCGVRPTAPTPATTPQPAKPVVSDDFVNRLDGSTATIPLGSALMKALTGTDKGMLFNKTDPAYQNLIRGDKDLILVTKPSEEELADAKAAGVELEVIPVVKDALIFLANTANAVPGLTQEQVKQIYTGKITKWSEVGGSNTDIIPYQRQVNSGSQTLFLDLAMQGETPMDAPTQLRPSEMSALVDVIADYDNSVNALGYSVFYYATQMYLKDNVKLLAIDGVTPSAQTISNETYPYLTYYYAVLRADTPADSEARQVVAWLLGDEAQQMASRNNYVPLSHLNIAPPEPEYGYFGSTKTNTTQSSGTGGTKQKSVDNLSSTKIHCDHTGGQTLVSVDGQDAMSTAITNLNKQLGDMGSCPHAVTKDIAIVDSSDTTVLIGADGKTLGLSDLFYDSVNYITFINQNLFNEATNPLYADWLRNDYWPENRNERLPPSGFTGLPSDYTNFTVSMGGRRAGMMLTFAFPDGNPFFPVTTQTDYSGKQSSSNAAQVPLQLPSDLSPYGRLYTASWVTRSVDGRDQIIPGITTTSTRSAGDDQINQKIQAVATAHPEYGCLTLVSGQGRVSLLAYTDAAVCLTPAGATGWPTVVGQWTFSTWIDDPMTASDLPADWHTPGPYPISLAGAVVCPIGRTDNESCRWAMPKELGVTAFSDQAKVDSVWSGGNGIVYAIVTDGSQVYAMGYDAP